MTLRTYVLGTMISLSAVTTALAQEVSQSWIAQQLLKTLKNNSPEANSAYIFPWEGFFTPRDVKGINRFLQAIEELKNDPTHYEATLRMIGPGQGMTLQEIQDSLKVNIERNDTAIKTRVFELLFALRYDSYPIESGDSLATLCDILDAGGWSYRVLALKDISSPLPAGRLKLHLQGNRLYLAYEGLKSIVLLEFKSVPLNDLEQAFELMKYFFETADASQLLPKQEKIIRMSFPGDTGRSNFHDGKGGKGQGKVRGRKGGSYKNHNPGFRPKIIRA